MKKYLILGAVLTVLLPGVAFAQTTGLTSSQINAIVGLLQAFGADQSVINNVDIALGDTPTETTVAPQAPTTFTTPNGAVIDANGNVITPAPETAQNVQLQAQQEQVILAPLNNEISQLQTQSTSCTNAMVSSPIGQGLSDLSVEAQAAGCENLSSELSVFLAEKSIIQQGGVMTSACSAEISTLDKQIYALRQRALGEEGGDLSSGTSVVGEGNAQLDAQTEANQEAPLLQQVQQNLYYCQN
jgi:hypothetical protein